MARHISLIVAALALTLVGCQPTRTSMIDNLPTPSFNGPTVVAPRPLPLAQAPAPAPLTPAPRSLPSANGLGELAWIPPVPPRTWDWIVIHHSATPSGSAAEFDRMHREKGWDELGYHFVIGNGTGSGNGQVEIGPRWPKQKWGAHAKTPDNAFNDHGIGICLVGNFDIERPTQQQMASLAKLVSFLMATYHIPADHVIGHGTVHLIAHAGTVTDCPGRNLSVGAVRTMAGQILASHGLAIAPSKPARTDELLGSISP